MSRGRAFRRWRRKVYRAHAARVLRDSAMEFDEDEIRHFSRRMQDGRSLCPCHGCSPKRGKKVRPQDWRHRGERLSTLAIRETLG